MRDRTILKIGIISAVFGALGAPQSVFAQEPVIAPKVVARYLVGTWGLRASEDDYHWFEVPSRCGKVSGAISQPVDEDTQQQISGIVFDQEIGGGTTIKGMLAFGQKGSDLAVISRFKNDTVGEMFDDGVKPKTAIFETIKPTANPKEFYVGKIPGLLGERTIKIVSMDQFILLADPKDKGGFGGGVPDREFHRCTNGNDFRSLKP